MWRDLVGFEDSFEVSDAGVIRSKPRFVEGRNGRRWHGQKIIAQWVMPKGYVCVTVQAGGRRSNVTVHKAVLEAFVGPRPEGLECRHLDGDPSNNHLSNIEWGTPSENNGADKDRHGTMYQRAKTHCPQGHPLEGDNLTPGGLREGKRRCLACSRSTYWRQTNLSYQRLSDLKYQAIVAARSA